MKQFCKGLLILIFSLTILSSQLCCQQKVINEKRIKQIQKIIQSEKKHIENLLLNKLKENPNKGYSEYYNIFKYLNFFINSKLFAIIIPPTIYQINHNHLRGTVQSQTECLNIFLYHLLFHLLTKLI